MTVQRLATLVGLGLTSLFAAVRVWLVAQVIVERLQGVPLAVRPTATIVDDSNRSD